jgi:hypothetical protein
MLFGNIQILCQHSLNKQRRAALLQF